MSVEHLINETELIFNEILINISILKGDMPTYFIFIFVFFSIFLLFSFAGILIKIFMGEK